MYIYVQWCIFAYIVFKGFGNSGGLGGEVGIVFVKSEYDVIFNTKMLSYVITIRQWPTVFYYVQIRRSRGNAQELFKH